MFIRTKIINGKTYRSLEERYREGGKVKSRYIRSLTNDGLRDGTGAHYQGEVAAFDGMVQQMKHDEAKLAAASKEPSNTDSKDVGEGDKGEAGSNQGGDVGDNGGGQGGGKGDI